MGRTGSLADQSFWRDLSRDEQDAIKGAMRRRRVPRGETLVEQGSPADVLFVVVFGLFDVRNATTGAIVAEIGADQLIGEIGFFADAPRTASVVAARDSEVLEIGRAEFEALAQALPEVYRAVTRALAKRLAALAQVVRNSESARPVSAFRVVAVVAAGSGELPEGFASRLRAAVACRTPARFLTAADAASAVSESPDPHWLAAWLADIERGGELVICVADRELTPWSEAVLRCADQTLLVASRGPEEINPVEALALDLFPKARRRLVMTQATRSHFGEPGERWRARRDAFMIHHVAMQDEDDFHSLARFLCGQAIGFVAGGGGAFGPAHIGIFKAFGEIGVKFDIFGGTSVGAAISATFALIHDADEVKAGIQEMFVRRGALKRFTYPRYGLLDHKVFDSELRTQYSTGLIEDAWKPYFAVASDLSTYTMRVIREGPVWEAIRASAAIPGVLPPFFDSRGHMLVDGGVADNVPLAAMRSLKVGPNVVVDLRPLNYRAYSISYPSIPGRGELLARLLNPWPRKKPLPRFPGPAGVIQRAIFGNVGAKPSPRDPTDLDLRPPPFKGSSFMNWDRHADVLDAAYEWTLKRLEALRAERDPALAAIEAAARG